MFSRFGEYIYTGIKNVIRGGLLLSTFGQHMHRIHRRGCAVLLELCAEASDVQTYARNYTGPQRPVA